MKQTMAATGAPPQAAASAHAVGAKHRFYVRFYRRMRQHRVYPAVVWSKGLGGGGVGGPVTLRAVIPGALVAPAEQMLDVSDARATATFYVTPVARGRLPEARIEVVARGSVVQTIRMPMRSTTQRLTWLLAFLTVALPAFLLYTTVYHKLQGFLPRVPNQQIMGGRAEENAAEPKEAIQEPKKEEPKQPPNNPVPGQQPITQVPSQDWLFQTAIGLIQAPGDVQKDEKSPKKDSTPPPAKPDDDKKEAPTKAKTDAKDAEQPPTSDKKEGIEEKKPETPAGGGPKEKKKAPGGKKGGGRQPKVVDVPPPEDLEPPANHSRVPTGVQRPGMPGEILEREILRHVPEVPYTLREQYPRIPMVTTYAAFYLGMGYDLLCALELEYLTFWVTVVMAALTLVSLITHRSVRGRRAGEPLTLPA